MRLHTRAPIERMAYISQLIGNGKLFQIAALVKRFEVSRKTIERDMVFMMDRLGFEFEYVRTGRVWRGRRPKERVL